MTSASLKGRTMSRYRTNPCILDLQCDNHDGASALRASYKIAAHNDRMPTAFDTRGVTRRGPFFQIGSTSSAQRICSFQTRPSWR